MHAGLTQISQDRLGPMRIANDHIGREFVQCQMKGEQVALFLGFFIAKKHTDLLIGFIAFALFGLSDYIEAHTGAWWTP